MTKFEKEIPIESADSAKITQDQEPQLSVFSATTAFFKSKLSPFVERFSKKCDNDSLSNWENEMERFKSSCLQSAKVWEVKRNEIIAGGLELIDSPKSRKTITIKYILQLIYQEIKSFVTSAQQAIHELNARTFPLIKKLGAELDVQCEQLKEMHPEADNQAKIKKIELKICNFSIETYDEIILLLNQVEREIKKCLGSEEFAENVAKLFVVHMIEALMRVRIPNYKFEMSELSLIEQFSLNGFYRNSLYERIQKETGPLNQLVKSTDAKLHEAYELIDKVEHNQSPKTLHRGLAS